MVSGSFSLLNNQNGQSGINYNFKSHGYSVAVAYTPKGSDRLVASLNYSRSDLNSDILYIIPQFLTSAQSLYIADSNYGGGDVDLRLVRNARMNFGGALINTTGNLPPLLSAAWWFRDSATEACLIDCRLALLSLQGKQPRSSEFQYQSDYSPDFVSAISFFLYPNCPPPNRFDPLMSGIPNLS